VQDYFKFYTKSTRWSKITLPIKKLSEVTAADGHLVMVGCALAGVKAPSGVSVAGVNLIISAPTAQGRYDIARKLLRVLDEKYTFYGKIGAMPASVFTMDAATGMPRGCMPKDKDMFDMRTKAGLGYRSSME
jgi:hypothetical protein